MEQEHTEVTEWRMLTGPFCTAHFGGVHKASPWSDAMFHVKRSSNSAFLARREFLSAPTYLIFVGLALFPRR
jgi:hypothetical protein